MAGMRRFLARTWLASALFLITYGTIWWVWLDWGSAQISILQTVFVAPALWWWIAGRRTRPGWLRGTLAGAAIGLATQGLPIIAPLWWYEIRTGGRPDPGGGWGAMAAGFVFILVTAWAVPVGAALGLIAAWIQAHRDRQQFQAGRES